jgi:hypothetical protein
MVGITIGDTHRFLFLTMDPKTIEVLPQKSENRPTLLLTSSPYLPTYLPKLPMQVAKYDR